MTNTHTTREAWLNAATDAMRPWFTEQGASLGKVRMSVGFMGGRGGAKLKAIGQCWSPLASGDQTSEIFIHPSLADAPTVLATLLHELVHAAVGVEHGHKRPFTRLAKALGLEGKMTATVAGEALAAKLATIADQLGPLPHACLDGRENSGPKKQSARMIKAECDCGYLVRLTRKWLNEVGAPHCPMHGQMHCEGQDDDTDDDE